MTRFIQKRLLPLCLLLIVPSGCTVGPDYAPPDVKPFMQQHWQSTTDSQFGEREPDSSWWRQFHDAELNNLIGQLFASNLPLQQAKERIVEANARAGIVAADKQLQLAAALGYTHAETGEKSVSLLGIPPDKTINVYSTGLTAGWELDIWGRTARLMEAAKADIGASYADYHAMMVSLAAELTLAYVEARTLEERLAIVRQNIVLQEKTLALAQNRLEAGNGTELDVARSQRLLESTRSRVPDLERLHEAMTARIGVLLGKPPRQKLLQTGAMPTLPPLIGVGLPAQLLTRRPDIRQAFQNYHAAVARIGAAEAERYPSLSLSGTLTLSSDTIGRMLNPDSLMYTLGPGLHFPLLTGGRIESNIAVRNSQAEQARLALEQRIVAALAEVETAATGVVRSQQQTSRLQAAEQAAAKSVQMADSLYRAGLVDFFQVLDGQQQLLVSQETLLIARQQALSEVVYLYRALGGGWQQAMTVSVAGQGGTDHNSPEQK